MRRTLWISFADNECASHAFSDMFDNILIWNEGSNIKEEDVVIFSGGADINPEIYGEVKSPFTQKSQNYKDERERIVFRRAQANGASCIGVCRGAQLLCALSGGKLIQHVTGHSRPHNIVTYEGRVLMNVSSAHHQMMWPYSASRYLLMAYSLDKGKYFCEYGKEPHSYALKGETGPMYYEPEIVWFPDTRSLCFQPHPEEPYHEKNEDFPKYCRTLIEKWIFSARNK